VHYYCPAINLSRTRIDSYGACKIRRPDAICSGFSRLSYTFDGGRINHNLHQRGPFTLHKILRERGACFFVCDGWMVLLLLFMRHIKFGPESRWKNCNFLRRSFRWSEISNKNYIKRNFYDLFLKLFIACKF